MGSNNKYNKNRNRFIDKNNRAIAILREKPQPKYSCGEKEMKEITGVKDRR